jgi:DNA-directed RNA polymerase sigma subunit (sigma70/sigma32)
LHILLISMQTIYIDIRFEGDKFSPKLMKKLTNFQLLSLAEYGEIAKTGRYKNRPSPYGMAILKTNEPIGNEDINKVLNNYIEKLYKKAEDIKKSGVQEIIFEIGSSIDTSSELSIDKRILKKLAKLNAKINFYTIGSKIATPTIKKEKQPFFGRNLKEINNKEHISAEEERILAGKIQKGDEKALEKLTKANLRFVISVAKHYQNKGLSLPDLINEGNLGLIKAAKRFDPSLGFKFMSYAVWWIRQSILQALERESSIKHFPLDQISSLNKLNKAFLLLEHKFEREPYPNELFEVSEPFVS